MGARHQLTFSKINSLGVSPEILVKAFVLALQLLGSVSPSAVQVEAVFTTTEGASSERVTTPSPTSTTTHAANNLTFAPISHSLGWLSKNVSTVEFLLYHNSSDPETYAKIPFTNISWKDNKTIFRINRPLKVLIHGFTEDRKSEFPRNVKNAYLDLLNRTSEEKRFNILVIDWGRMAGAPKTLFSPLYYTDAVENVNPVGKRIADFMISLLHGKILRSFDDVHVIGFSLGAQVAGVVGHRVFNQSAQKLGRITGLDPAGPLFYTVKEENGLDSSDAIFVDVIHTNGGLLGHSKALGHMDIFPNGGRKQPSCVKDWGGLCSHRLAHQLFLKSIYDPGALVACKCESWEEFSKCSADSVEYMKVGESSPITARGSYYLEVK